MSTRDERMRRARAYLAAAAEPPAAALAAFVAECGPVRAVELIERGREPEEVGADLTARHVSADEVLAATEQAGARLVVPEDPEWPEGPFAVLARARAVGVASETEPLALWARGQGTVGALLERAVAVVGARAASGYGEHVAAEIAHGAARAGWTVVSGAAYGIDGAAHRGALSADRRTVAFLACGIDRDYPAGHGRLLRVIAGQGVVLSEYPPGTEPRRHRFLVRNRLIAAAGQAAVVVEAGARSGAVNTANHADALGHPVMAVPGPVTAKNSVGCHDLLRSGRAALATGAGDLLEMLEPLGSVAEPAAGPAEEPAEQRAGPNRNLLPAQARDVLDALESGTAGADEVARRSAVPLRTVRALLPELELAGFTHRSDRGWSLADSAAEHGDTDAAR
ncbi:DNA-processing protein DprA [Salinifilum aidingensis]